MGMKVCCVNLIFKFNKIVRLNLFNFDKALLLFIKYFCKFIILNGLLVDVGNVFEVDIVIQQESVPSSSLSEWFYIILIRIVNIF